MGGGRRGFVKEDEVAENQGGATVSPGGSVRLTASSLVISKGLKFG